MVCGRSADITYKYVGRQDGIQDMYCDINDGTQDIHCGISGGITYMYISHKIYIAAEYAAE